MGGHVGEDYILDSVEYHVIFDAGEVGRQAGGEVGLGMPGRVVVRGDYTSELGRGQMEEAAGDEVLMLLRPKRFCGVVSVDGEEQDAIGF